MEEQDFEDMAVDDTDPNPTNPPHLALSPKQMLP
jgi:hypothetical protein